MNVRQVVVTFFNRRFSDRFNKALDEAWLRLRWDLFLRFPVSSLAHQTISDFDWVILFHERSPKWLRDAAQNLSLPCRVHLSFDHNCIEALMAPGRLLNDVHLVTRLDSDDALHRCSLERIRQAFETFGEKYDAYNFEFGYQYDTVTQRLVLTRAESPPFGTRVYFPPVHDPVDSGPEHNRWPSLYRYADISFGDPLFLQVVHGDNLLNRISYTGAPISRPLSREILRAAFNVVDDFRPVPARYFTQDLVHLLWQLRRTRH